MKRTFDIVLAVAGILIIWPFLAIIALLVFFYLGLRLYLDRQGQGFMVSHSRYTNSAN